MVLDPDANFVDKFVPSVPGALHQEDSLLLLLWFQLFTEEGQSATTTTAVHDIYI